MAAKTTNIKITEHKYSTPDTDSSTRFLPSFFTGLIISPLYALMINPITKLNVHVINRIDGDSLTTWRQKFKVGCKHPFRGAPIGIITALFSNTVLFTIRPMMHTTSQYLFPNHKLFNYALADTCAGALSGAIISGVVTVRVRQQYSYDKSVIKTIRKMRENKVSFFVSTRAHALRNGMYNGLFFPLSHIMNEHINSLSYEQLQKSSVKNLTNGAVGVVSAITAARLTYPLHIITTRQKVKYEPALDVIQRLYRADGFRAFSRGFWQLEVAKLSIGGALVNIVLPITAKFFSNRSDEKKS